MSNTQNVYTGDGITVIYSFSWPYLSRDDINVQVNNTPQTLITDYTFESDQTIRFVNPPSDQSRIVIFRVTDTSDIEHVFYPGSAIRAKDLNTDFTQSLFVNQESQNRVYDASEIGYTYPPELGSEYSNVQDALSEALTTGGGSGGGSVTSVNGQVGIVNLGLDDLNDVSVKSITGPPTQLCYEGSESFTISVLANGVDTGTITPELLKITSVTFDSTETCVGGGSRDFYNIDWVDTDGVVGSTKLQFGGPCGSVVYTWTQNYSGGENVCSVPGPAPAIQDNSVLIYDSDTLNWVAKPDSTVIGGNGISTTTDSDGNVTIKVSLAGTDDGLKFKSGKLAASTATTSALGSVKVGDGLDIDTDGTLSSTFDPDDLKGEYLSLAAGTDNQNVQSTGNTTFAGKVGIGTDAPLSTLHIDNGTTASGGINISDSVPADTATKPSIKFSGIDGDYTRIRSFRGANAGAAGAALYFETGGNLSSSNAKMVIEGGGYVGIGTTVPDRRLHVVDSVNRVAKFQSSSSTVNLELKDDTTTKLLAIGRVGEDLRFYTDDTVRAYIKSDGNVGIGTDNPQSRLQVAESGGATIRLTDSDSGGGVGSALITADGTTALKLQASAGTTGKAITFFHKSTAEAMRIADDGNVGIGSNSPESTLHFAKNASISVRYEKTNEATDNKTFLQGYSGDRFYWQALDDSGSGGGNLVRLTRTGSSIDSFECQKGGSTWFKADNTSRRVGIGTDDPQAKLDVNGTIKATGIQFPGSSSKLDDYEEGTWTPIVTQDATTPLYTATPNSILGKYVKTGSIVNASIIISFNPTITPTDAGKISVTLPFAQAINNSAGTGVASNGTNMRYTLPFNIYNSALRAKAAELGTSAGTIAKISFTFAYQTDD